MKTDLASRVAQTNAILAVLAKHGADLNAQGSGCRDLAVRAGAPAVLEQLDFLREKYSGMRADSEKGEL